MTIVPWCGAPSILISPPISVARSSYAAQTERRRLGQVVLRDPFSIVCHDHRQYTIVSREADLHALRIRVADDVGQSSWAMRKKAVAVVSSICSWATSALSRISHSRPVRS